MTATKKERGPTVTIEHLESGKDVIGGKIEMSADVVETIAGLAARETDGIHSLGRSTLISFNKDDPKRGVGAEVGNVEAAIDLEVTTDYGVDIRKVVANLRKAIAQQVDKMAGRKVIEVNVKILGIHFPEAEVPMPSPKNDEPQPRVR